MSFRKKRHLKALVLIAIGVIVAFPLFSMTYYTMVGTPHPNFVPPPL